MGYSGSVFPAKLCKGHYLSHFKHRNLILDWPIDLKSFSSTCIPSAFTRYGWTTLTSFFGSANSTLVKLFYSNLIEHDMDVMFLKSSINGTIIHIALDVIAKELNIPLTVGLSATEIIISDTLLKRAAQDSWNPLGLL